MYNRLRIYIYLAVFEVHLSYIIVNNFDFVINVNSINVYKDTNKNKELFLKNYLH